MALTALYRKYFQKSKIFMYPILDIKRGSCAVPTETYISWKDIHNSEDAKLICVYHTKNDPEYIQFENNVLLKHNRLCDYSKVDSTTSVFIFDFSDLKNDWFQFVNGKYSKINENLKRKILNYFDDNSANHIYVESYLFPDKFYEQYASILNVDVSLLKTVGELCTKPDLEKETLLIIVENLENIKILN
jgi:hypothetical protein